MTHFGISYENCRGMQKDLSLATRFCRLAAARDHVAAWYSLAVMMANGKGVKSDLEKALTLILISKQNTRLNPYARLLLNKVQTAIEGLLNTAQINRSECQVAKLFSTQI